jgi:hypothetical protein
MFRQLTLLEMTVSEALQEWVPNRRAKGRPVDKPQEMLCALVADALDRAGVELTLTVATDRWDATNKKRGAGTFDAVLNLIYTQLDPAEWRRDVKNRMRDAIERVNRWKEAAAHRAAENTDSPSD